MRVAKNKINSPASPHYYGVVGLSRWARKCKSPVEFRYWRKSSGVIEEAAQQELRRSRPAFRTENFRSRTGFGRSRIAHQIGYANGPERGAPARLVLRRRGLCYAGQSTSFHS